LSFDNKKQKTESSNLEKTSGISLETQRFLSSSYLDPEKLDAHLRRKFPGVEYTVEVGTLLPFFTFSQLTVSVDATKQMDGIP
jgi:hypothetical protein